jgi:hypothetical protein
MSLLNYDFNNPSMAGSETASVRVASRCHTTDRGPSRNQRVNDEFAASKQGEKNEKIGVQNSTQ